jgi:energy-coupling factor transport system ATP-binding protein
MYEHRLHAPHLLSGGQKQRVAIAGVIAMEPEIIVLDEPTAMLDPQGRREVVDTAFSLCHGRGMTVILITHHMEECIDADRVLILSKGRLTADGRPEEIFANKALLDREGLEEPETARLLRELRAAGVKLRGEALDTKGCAALIAQALQAEERSRS